MAAPGRRQRAATTSPALNAWWCFSKDQTEDISFNSAFERCPDGLSVYCWTVRGAVYTLSFYLIIFMKLLWTFHCMLYSLTLYIHSLLPTQSSFADLFTRTPSHPSITMPLHPLPPLFAEPVVHIVKTKGWISQSTFSDYVSQLLLDPPLFRSSN